MDIRVSQKEERLQKDGLIDVYVPDIFDAYLVVSEEDPLIIENAEILDDKEALQQECLFGTLKQRGSDPVSPDEGVRWAEYVLGEIPVETLLTDIKASVVDVAANCSVDFDIIEGADGLEHLVYEIKVG